MSATEQQSSTTTVYVHQSPEKPSQETVPMCTLTQHSVLRITLDGPTLVLAILAIIISIQIFQPSFTCTLIALSPIPWIIHNDYENFISLGPGGTPSTFLGYLKIAYLRLFALSDPYTPACPFPGDKLFPSIGCYQRKSSWLPHRRGPRPAIAGIAPQRQLNQPSPTPIYLSLRAALTSLASSHPSSLSISQSCFEKKGLALFARNPINATCRGEICHVHHSDRSLHMNLHPDDAKVVLEKGWGERHPLSKGGWMRRFVPREFVLVYAPRDEAELRVVGRIIEAAGWWVAGGRFEMDVETGKNHVLELEARKLGNVGMEEEEGKVLTLVPEYF